MKSKYYGAQHHQPPCHHGPVEVVDNLFLGSEDESIIMASPRISVDTLVPLNGLDPDVWKTGFRGEVLYYPIRDYGVLPDDVLSAVVSSILDRLGQKKKVGVFCVGGHGRTGYVASVVLGKLGHKDPIRFLRSKYCKKAVESNAQIRHIAEMVGRPELVDKYKGSDFVDGFDFIAGHRDYSFKDEFELFSCPSSVKCSDCDFYRDGKCELYEVHTHGDDPACDEFFPKEE